jgi:hypothetical protein
VKIATYNVEWFSNLFDDAGELRGDDGWSERWDMTRAQQIAALGVVFQAMDADVIMVIEGLDAHSRRNGAAALEVFADRFGRRAREAIIGYVNETKKEILFLYDLDVLTVRHNPRSDGAPRFDETMVMHSRTRSGGRNPQLELAVMHTSGTEFRLIGVHAKSKAPHGARNEA